MKSVKVLLKFPSGQADMPVAWKFATEYGLEFSILQADIRPDRGGRCIMDITGEPENIEDALYYCRHANVQVTVLSRTMVWDDECCVHCGACTAVCSKKALSLDKETAELRFDNSKCIVCEMCIPACPTGAMRVDLMP